LNHVYILNHLIEFYKNISSKVPALIGHLLPNKFGFRTSAVNDSDLDDKMLLELDNFVKSNGGSITGTLNMNKNRIMNLANPTESLDAATKKYVDRIDNKTSFALRCK
jgi:hypothetical protein